MVAERTYGDLASAARAALNGVEAAAGVKKPDAILSADGIRRHFGGIVAVDVKHLEVQRGSITAFVRSEVPTLFMWISVLDSAPSASNSFTISVRTTNRSFP